MRRLVRSLGLDLTPLRESATFRLLFTARIVSLVGLGMLVVALPAQVYALTGSSWHVAAVNTTLGLTAFVGTLAAGVVADRVDRRRVVLWSRAAAVLGFVALLVNALAPEPSLAVVYAVAAWDGLVGGFSVVALAAAVPALVERSQLPAVGALMAISIDLAAVVSPLVAGLVLAQAAGSDAATQAGESFGGAGAAAGVYAVVVVASVVSLAFLWRLPALPPGGDEADDEPRGSVGRDLVDGLRYLTTDRVVGGVVLLGFVQILFASPHVLLPAFADTRLDGGPETLGYLYAATAVGALVATLTSSWTGRVRRTGRALLLILAASALGVAGLGLAHTVPVALAAMVLVGAGDVLGEILRFTLLYERTPDRMRGRVSSLWTAQGTAGDALGGPLLTLVARTLGPGGAIVVGGVAAAVATAAVALLVPGLRHAVTEPDDDLHDFDSPDRDPHDNTPDRTPDRTPEAALASPTEKSTTA